MNIPYAALNQHITPLKNPCVIISGQDTYLLNDAASRIKQAYHPDDVDQQTMHIQQPSDWQSVFQEANSYSLFSHYRLLDIRMLEKTWDANTKKSVLHYLSQPNSRCLLLIRAPNLTHAALQWINQSSTILHVQAQPLAPRALQMWIKQQFQHQAWSYDASIPELIQTYTQNNMLACAQVIEKLSLVHDKQTTLTIECVRPYLDEQSHYPLYEWADLCLKGDLPLALERLRRARDQRTEVILMLWFIAQEIRQLIQIKYHSGSVPAACQALKIWSSRVALYTQASHRLSLERLEKLIFQAQQLDEHIKTFQTQQPWTQLERMVVQFCTSEHT